ncbi:hypothetical protein N7495_006688 [Penicillium taxi]|uniref:uncharacterized protein n=1 Tax=Penicillium taxi TaxID=168475 RepID=UPI002544F576|nr:uncharacterized protein N7495_006688 [Penicillium taxi]KAJ5894997.1 hypothetical protein N7495_006688 [Penicillium taxi]
MHSAMNYRQSRRSACDRCRGFKLRCERDQGNGRSCERCLKAQVVCTTNIGQPATNYLPSKSNSWTLSRDFDGRYISSEQHAMPILHKPSISKVKKPSISSSTSRRHDHLGLHYWGDSEKIPYPTGERSRFIEDQSFQCASHPVGTFPFEPWGDQMSPWTATPFQVPLIDDFMFEPDHRLRSQLSFSDTPMIDYSRSIQNSTSIETASLSTERLNSIVPDSILLSDSGWESSWENSLQPTRDEELPKPAVDSHFMNSCSLRKSLLRLGMELIDDLEFLETEKFIFGSSSLLREDINPMVRKLDLPIFRMLNHSTQFIEILQRELVTLRDRFSFPSVDISQSPFDEMKCAPVDTLENYMEDAANTASSYDSGYLTVMASPVNQGQIHNQASLDISTALSILSTYSHLNRVYRAVFTQLYQLLLVIPPHYAAPFLLLPNFKFGQFHMEGSLTVQIQVLIELSSDMLAKIERALGMSSGPCCEVDGESSPAVFIMENSPVASIRDLVMTQEHVTCGISLKETMSCLGQLVKEPTGL